MPTTASWTMASAAIVMSAAALTGAPQRAYAADTVLLRTVPHVAAAANCNDQRGKVIVDDTFADDTGGWPARFAPGVTVTYGKPDLTIHVVAPAISMEMLNTSAFPKDGDYCLQVKAPAGHPDGSVTTSGLRFIDTPDAGYLVEITSNGNFVFCQWVNNDWQTIASKKDPSIRPGDVVTLRASVHNGLVTASGNGQELKRIRLPIPDRAVKFGMQIQNGIAVPDPGTIYELVRLRVTTGD